jgi:hypothetical protein
LGRVEVNNWRNLCSLKVGKVSSSLKVMVVPKTLENFLDRKTQLYDQGLWFIHKVHNTNFRVKKLAVFLPPQPSDGLINIAP